MIGNRIIGPPSKGNGDRYYRHVDHINHLVMYHSPAARTIKTAQGMADAAVCGTAVDCITCERHWSETPIFGQVFVPALVDADVDVVVGRVIQGTAAAGRSAPWLLEEPSDDDLRDAQTYLDGNEEEMF